MESVIWSNAFIYTACVSVHENLHVYCISLRVEGGLGVLLLRVYAYSSVYMGIHICICVFVRIYIYMYMYIYVNIHIQTCDIFDVAE